MRMWKDKGKRPGAARRKKIYCLTTSRHHMCAARRAPPSSRKCPLEIPARIFEHSAAFCSMFGARNVLKTASAWTGRCWDASVESGHFGTRGRP